MTVARLVGLVVLIFLLVTVISEPLDTAATARSGGAALGSAGTSLGEFVSSLTSGAFSGVGTAAADEDPASSYTVRPGDTLSEIAAAHATTTDALADGNDIDDPDLIAPGQELSVR